MSNSLAIVWIHLVWSTKNRQPMIKKLFKGQLNTTIKEEASKKGIQIDIVNGTEDHIHVLLRLKTTQSISVVVNWIKGRSSKWINDNFYKPGEFKWQKGYGVFSVDPKDVNRVRKYIYDQEKHHLKQSYYQEIKFFSENRNIINQP
ncbi:MAG: IS200/IS605 family transposase [Balneola sp.]